MRVVRLVSELDFGGLEKVVELVSLELSPRIDVELCVVVLSKGGKTSELLLSQGIKVMVLDDRVRIPNLTLIFRLKSILNQLKPDILHCSGAEANFHGLVAGFLARIKVRFGEEIGFPNHGIMWEIVFKATYLFSHKVIAISKAVQQFIVDKGEVPVHKTTIIYNPVQVFDLPEINSKREGFTFITVARLVSIKNIEGLLVAFSQVVAPDKSLLILGDGPSKESLRELVFSLGIASQVQFLGFQNNVSQILLQADCFVLPSFSEGSSVALAEAMMARLPSIVTKVGGASEILGDSDSGILIDPYDVAGLKKAMEYMIDISDGKRRLMGKKARDYVLNRFSPSIHVDQLQALYRNLLNAKG